MLGKDGLTGLEGLRSSSRRRNGNSGFQFNFSNDVNIGKFSFYD